MKKLKEKVLKIIILLTVVSSTLPFFCHDVYADTISSSDIQGVERVLVNSTYLDQTVTNSGNTYKYYSFDYEVTVLLKDYYLGWIQGTFQTSYKTFDNADWSVQNSSCTTVSKSYYVNGNSFSSTFTVSAWVMVNQQGNIDPAGSYTTSFSLSNSNVTLYQDIDSIDTVIDLLDSINTNTMQRNWNFPMESYAFVYKFFKSNLDVIDIQTNNYYSYPMFALPTNSTLLKSKWSHGTDADDMVMIFGINKNVHNRTELERNFTLDNFKFISLSPIEREDVGSPFTIVKLIYNIQSTSSSNYATLIPKLDLNIMPIYNDFLYNTKYTSSEFALMYGLSNQLIDDVHQIAQGTQSSSSSSSDLEDSSSDFDDVADDVYNLENSFNTGLNNSLQQIDTSFDVGNTFGSKFLLAADWVRVQFNTITASNPFGTILSFSLLLGVALLIIGKVLG